MSVMQNLEAIAKTKMPAYQFRLALQRIARSDPALDLEAICVAVSVRAFPKSPKKAQQAAEGFKALLSRYSAPARVMNDYKVLINAYGYQYQLSQRNT